MTVRRTLPQRERSLIGAWCFVDHYGPDQVVESGGMSVGPHPHTGLQTVSWLFEGEVTHRDSAGNHAQVRPGEVNLMTGGRGISHSEVSTAGTTTLYGAQLWVALPESARNTDPGFAHYAPPELTGPGWRARVFLGSALGSVSPVETFTPLLGAEINLEPNARVEVDADPSFEHGVLIDHGDVSLACPAETGAANRGDLLYAPTGADRLVLTAGSDGARILLLGGPPFGESIVMWWNFVARSHEEIVAFRAEWQEQITVGGDVVADGQHVTPGRYGVVLGEQIAPIPAPPMPNARLRERR